MKEAILGLGLMFILLYGMLMDVDLDTHASYRYHLKAVAEETAASAAQYFKVDVYGDGYYDFEQSVGNIAADTTLINSLNLDAQHMPKAGSYWTDKVQMQLTYIDYSNYDTYLAKDHPYYDNTRAFPNYYIYTHFGMKSNPVYLDGPSVISTINAGRPNYLLAFLRNLKVTASDGSLVTMSVKESGIHTLKETD